MKKNILLFLLPILLFGQSNFFGYYEGEFDRIKFANQTYNYGYNKLLDKMSENSLDPMFWLGEFNEIVDKRLKEINKQCFQQLTENQ